MPYRVNGKNLTVGRMMVRGKDANKRLKYILVGPKGTLVTNPATTVRVSLPPGELQPAEARIIPQNEIDLLGSGVSDAVIELPAGEPAETTAAFFVPNVDSCFPEPEEQFANFTCNADTLRKLLTIASEVVGDGCKTIRLRFCADNKMRLDTYREPGQQEFCAVIKGVNYKGSYIPGDIPDGEMRQEKKPEQGTLVLKANGGRRFRGEGE